MKNIITKILLFIVFFGAISFNIYYDSTIQRIGSIIAMNSMLILILFDNAKKKST
jgi:hypothetical protein